MSLEQQLQQDAKDFHQYLLECLRELADSSPIILSSVLSLDYARALRMAKTYLTSFNEVLESGRLVYSGMRHKYKDLQDAAIREAIEKEKTIVLNAYAQAFRILSVKVEVSLEQLEQYKDSTKPDPILISTLNDIKSLKVDEFLEMVISS